MLRLFIVFAFALSPACGWWCEGHEVVAYIAEHHLTPHARLEAEKLLRENPADTERFCKDPTTDLLALASTWADDVKPTEKTGMWHYMDIPLELKKGDPEKWCEPIGPSNNGGERPGCILSALRYAVNVLHSDKEPDNEKAVALRHLIHLVGDLHQPLHTTTNNDRGGNCTPVHFFDDPQVANLHSVWDGMIFKRDLFAKHETPAMLAAEIDERFAPRRADWVKKAPQFDKWAWEGHVVAQRSVYGNLDPEPPAEPFNPKADCQVEAARFGALHLHVTDVYQAVAVPIVEEQLAKAGYRLAEILNLIWP